MWRAPLLSVRYEAKQGDPYWDHVLIAEESFFLRIRVTNARGCDAARDVEVIVTSFRSGELGLDERSLERSGQRPPKGRPVTKLDIAPGLTRHLDVMQIGRRGGRGAEQARLCVFPKPGGGSHLVGRRTAHELGLIVTAANADAVSYVTAISYEGGMKAVLLHPPRATNRPFRHRARMLVKRL